MGCGEGTQGGSGREGQWCPRYLRIAGAKVNLRCCTMFKRMSQILQDGLRAIWSGKVERRKEGGKSMEVEGEFEGVCADFSMHGQDEKLKVQWVRRVKAGIVCLCFPPPSWSLP